MRLSIPASASGNVLVKEPVRRSLWAMAMRRFFRNRIVLVALAILILLFLAAIFAPQIAPFDPIKRDVPNRLLPPSSQFLLGTDALGRDQLSRILHGGRMSLYLGFASVIISLVLGVTLGLVSGYAGGLIDSSIMRVMDLILAFPGILFAIWLVSLLGAGVNQVIIANALFALPTFARVVRGSVLSLRQSDYVLAARSLGATGNRIVAAHILPNVLAPIIVLASVSISGAILTAASLSFLGLGPQPPTPEWGSMLADGRAYIRNAWWLAVFPGIILTLTVLSTNLIGDALRDALDPKMVMK